MGIPAISQMRLILALIFRTQSTVRRRRGWFRSRTKPLTCAAGRSQQRSRPAAKRIFRPWGCRAPGCSAVLLQRRAQRAGRGPDRLYDHRGGYALIDRGGYGEKAENAPFQPAARSFSLCSRGQQVLHSFRQPFFANTIRTGFYVVTNNESRKYRRRPRMLNTEFVWFNVFAERGLSVRSQDARAFQTMASSTCENWAQYPSGLSLDTRLAHWA